MQNQQNTLFVGNLSFSSTKEDLQKLFATFGNVLDVKIPTDFQTGKPRGFAFVSFETEDAAQSSLSLDGTEHDGRALTVRIAENKPQNKGPRTFGGGNGNGNGNGGRSFGGGNRKRF